MSDDELQNADSANDDVFSHEIDHDICQDIAEELQRAGYVGVTPLLVAQMHQQRQEQKLRQDVISQAILESLRKRLGE